MAVKKKTPSNGLAPQKTNVLSKPKTMITVGALEAALLKRFPREDAESWDRTGLLVGDPAALAVRIAVALDPTVEAIKEAEKEGANVLLTHHPVYLNAPDIFEPADSVAQKSGAAVWEAITNKVALMAFHTALDVSRDAAVVLPSLLNLRFEKIVLPFEKNARKGYGQLCALAPSEKSLTLGQLASRCLSVFGRHPRVWGAFNTPLSRIVTCTGSVGEVGAQALALQADCLVCGEIKYHEALSLSQAGLSIIDLGHDTTELPLVAVLVAALERVGIEGNDIRVIEQNSNWDYPESIRV